MKLRRVDLPESTGCKGSRGRKREAGANGLLDKKGVIEKERKASGEEQGGDG